ncbi:MAG: hypothetical protein J5857_02570 [Treponema sp.]|nr:hypothetical protein [Treponema sp.]
MMKKLIMIFCIALLNVFAAMATPAAINFDNLPDDSKLSQLLVDFGNAYPAIKNPDLQNKDKKASQLKSAKNLYNYLKKKKKANYDEKLFQLLAARCLYNFDQIKSSEITKLFSDIDSAYPEKAEHHWIYGNYLTSACKTIEGNNELEKYMEMKDYYISEAFIQDYAYCQFMCNTPFNAYYTLTNGGSIPEENVKDQELLRIVKNQIKESSSKEKYDANTVWHISDMEDGWHYVYSTMLGISFPCKPKWNLQLNEFSENSPAICLLGPNDFSINGHSVGISVLIMAYPESIYTSKEKDRLMAKLKTTKTEKQEISGKTFTKYTFEDPTSYTDFRNGQIGYLYEATINPGKLSTVKCEHPADLASRAGNSSENKSEGNQTFYAIKPSQNRIQEPMRIFILVDSCNALKDETDQLLEELFSKAVFD